MLISKGLVCPLDQTALVLKNNSLVCENNHCFDLAKQGYCNLLPVQDKRSKDPGDSREMVNARASFLGADIYLPVAELIYQQILPLLNDENINNIADAGCGEGYYLNYLAKKLEQDEYHARLIGFDISKWGIQKAAKKNKNITWLVASNRHPPILNNYLDFYLCMFGFPQYSAFANNLKKNGYLIMLDAAENHLIELRKLIYDEVNTGKEFNKEDALKNGFELISEQKLLVSNVRLNNEQLQQLLLMTPHFFRAPASAKIKLAELAELDITIDCSCRIFQLKNKL